MEEKALTKFWVRHDDDTISVIEAKNEGQVWENPTKPTVKIAPINQAPCFTYEILDNSVEAPNIESARDSLGQAAQLRGKCPGPLRANESYDIFRGKNPTERFATCIICGIIHQRQKPRP